MKRLDVVQTAFGKDIGFSLRTFRFTDGQSSSTDQDQTISCELHLESLDSFGAVWMADVPQEQAADCICYSADECSGKIFPFSNMKSEIFNFLFRNFSLWSIVSVWTWLKWIKIDY